MKKMFLGLLCSLMVFNPLCLALAAPAPVKASVNTTVKAVAKNAVKIAFVFDGPSDANAYFLKTFKTSIQKSMDVDTVAEFPAGLVYVGDWTEKGVKAVSDKALNSNANVVVSLGYLSSKYLLELPNKKKDVVTIDQYGLRDFGPGFFSPVSQLTQKIDLFHRLTNFKKVAILMNENYYKTRSDWNTFLNKKLAGKGFEYSVIPVNGSVDKAVANLPQGTDAAFVLPLLNLNITQLTSLFSQLNDKKILTFSSLGESDVKLGCMLGSGALDLDRKITEATSFNIKGVLSGAKYKSDKLYFYEDDILYINTDTAEKVNYETHIRLLNNAKVISNKVVPQYNLATVFNKLSEQNLDIERKSFLVQAARKSALSAKLRYLPTLSMTLGFQQYNEDYAKSAALLIPEKTGIFGLGVEQVIYSPALVTNILINNRKVEFSKAEYFATEQNMGINVALLYIDTLILKNAIGIQQEYVKEARENLAIARVREKIGYCGKEEVMRWASQLSLTEQKLLDMTADYKNVKLAIAKMLNEPANVDFDLAELKSNDPAFYTSELHVLDYVRTPQALEQFTQMLVEESFEVAPELTKLKTAIKMKEHERSMYIQKFILPDAKVAFEYQSLMNREYGKDKLGLIPPNVLAPGHPGLNLPLSALHSNSTYGRVGVYAQWKPIEGGSKFAEISRINAEVKELNAYSENVKLELEDHIRAVVNKALACYFSIEKEYKAMFTAKENYETVKVNYLMGKSGIAQLIDAQETYFTAKSMAVNSQNNFFKELVWVQRGLCSVNWTTASPRSKAWIQKVKTTLEAKEDITL